MSGTIKDDGSALTFADGPYPRLAIKIGSRHLKAKITILLLPEIIVIDLVD